MKSLRQNYNYNQRRLGRFLGPGSMMDSTELVVGL